MVLDDATSYILGSHDDVSMTEYGARDVLPEALAAAVRACVEVAYLRVRPEARWAYDYIPEGAVLKVLRATLPDERKVKVTVGNPPFPAGSVVTGILPAYEAIRKSFERIRVDDDLRRYIAGWVITMNLFTNHTELSGWTPGQAAGVKAPVADWADVVRLEAQAYLPDADTYHLGFSLDRGRPDVVSPNRT